MVNALCIDSVPMVMYTRFQKVFLIEQKTSIKYNFTEKNDFIVSTSKSF